jgi:hypothetical protein
MTQTGLTGFVIPWRDVLHEGPVPAGLDEAELRSVRAQFLSACGWGPERAIHAALTMRDLALDEADQHEEVVLWFEHDLYDQLQLIQVLNRLADMDLSTIRLTMVQVGDGRSGLGGLSPEEMMALFPGRVELGHEAVAAGRSAWQAFCSSEPDDLLVLERAGVASLPDLGPAIRRLLEEYPWTVGGLSRTERTALEELASGPLPLFELLPRVSAREEHVFLGDSTCVLILGRMIEARSPLLSRREPAGDTNPVYALTDVGRAVLEGAADMVRLNGIDRWVGGVHLEGDESPFRWNGVTATIERCATHG